jgi:hypothetical protein
MADVYLEAREIVVPLTVPEIPLKNSHSVTELRCLEYHQQLLSSILLVGH